MFVCVSMCFVRVCIVCGVDVRCCMVCVCVRFPVVVCAGLFNRVCVVFLMYCVLLNGVLCFACVCVWLCVFDISACVVCVSYCVMVYGLFCLCALVCELCNGVGVFVCGFLCNIV